MESKKKTLLAGSFIASALLAAAGLNANATGTTAFRDLGSGSSIRAQLLSRTTGASTLELKCGEKGKTDSTMAKKGKDGKCGEGKCGEGKCGGHKKMSGKKTGMNKKMKDSKAG